MFTYHHKVNYYECDRMGITHHSNYVRFMEEARIAWLDHIGMGFDRMEAEGYESPVIGISCQYRHSTTFPDDIEVEVRVKDVSSVKFSIEYKMRCNGELCCTGTSTHCFTVKGRPVVMERSLPDLYEALKASL